MISCLLKIGFLASVTFGQDLSGYTPESGYELSAAGSTYGSSGEVAQPGEEAYDYDNYDYEAESGLRWAIEADEGHDPIESIAENIPIFLVALLAVIFGQQIFLPVIAPLLNPATLATNLAPVGNIKIGILNVFLAPFGMAICTLAPTIAIVNPFGRSFSGEEGNSPEGFTFNAKPELVENIATTLYKAYLGECTPYCSHILSSNSLK